MKSNPRIEITAVLSLLAVLHEASEKACNTYPDELKGSALDFAIQGTRLVLTQMYGEEQATQILKPVTSGAV